MGKKVQMNNISSSSSSSSMISSSTIEYRLKWHPSTTPTLKKRFIDFSMLKKTLEKLYLKSKEELVPDEAETTSMYFKTRCEISSPPSLSHWSNEKWNPLTPTLRNLDFKQLRKTIEKLYMTTNKPISSPISVSVADRKSINSNEKNSENRIEKSLEF